MARENVLANRYTLLSPLGRGGMGQVWEAADTYLDRKVAVKLFTADRFTDARDSSVRRFVREATVTAGLAHPGVPAIFDAGTYNDGRFLVMELVSGCTVGDLVAEQGPLPLAWAAGIAAQVTAVLTVAHQRGILHRDIKPQNVMLTTDGTVKVLDFGIARVPSQRLTSTGVIIGTPGYIAPEQLHNLPATPQSDLYALGCLLYEMLAGRPVFAATSPAGLIRMHVEDPPPPLHRSDVPPHLASLLWQLLAKDPAARPPSARQVYDLLLPYVWPPGPLGDIDPALGDLTGAHLYPRLLAKLVAAQPWPQAQPATRRERRTAGGTQAGRAPGPAPLWRQTPGVSYDPAWALRHSLWLVPSVFLGGLGAFLSFGYIAARHRRVTWGVVAVSYLAVWMTAFISTAYSPESSVTSSVSVALLLSTWPVAIAHVLWVNITSRLPLVAARRP